MKKTLLSVVALLGLTAATAQVYTANDSTAFAGWTSIDADGDGNEFAAFNDLNGMSAASFSYDNATGPLTPDNLFISPAIDLSTATGGTLNYSVTAIDQSWLAEKYAVYIVTDLVAVTAGTFPTAVHEETLSETGVLTRSIDISTAAAGQAAVYVVIRHYDCTDNYGIGFNDLSVYGDFAGTEESSLEVLSAYPNPSTDVLNISLNSIVETVSILSLDGKLISNEIVNSNNAVLNVSDLATGVYFYEVITAEGDKLRNKFVKK